jgi:hypothetical protein
MKGHAMSKVSKRKSPLEIADLMLLQNPDASMETIKNVISEWGDLSNDHQFGHRESVEIEAAAPNSQLKSANLKFD